MRILVLVEDTVRFDVPGLRGEHGISLLIEHAGKRLLFDVGQSGLFIDNARLLGASLDSIDALVLSHGHYDHTGGLPNAIDLLEGRGTRLVAHPEVFEAKVRENGESIGSPIGFSEAEKAFNLELTAELLELGNGIYFTGEVPQDYERPEPLGYRLRDGARIPDELRDDASLIFDTEEGAIVVTGCAHAGIVNIARYAADVTGKPVHALVGGFHLVNASEERLTRTVAAFKEMEVDRILPGHCTGHVAVCRLAAELGAQKIDTGSVIDL